MITFLLIYGTLNFIDKIFTAIFHPFQTKTGRFLLQALIIFIMIFIVMMAIAIVFCFIGFTLIYDLLATIFKNIMYKVKLNSINKDIVLGINDKNEETEEEINRIKDEISTNRIYIVLLLVVIGIWAFIGYKGYEWYESSDNQNNQTVETRFSEHWALYPTSIDNFKYTINEDEITLEEYTGRDEKIRIDSFYTIDNKTYKVTKLSNGLFFSKTIHSIILPEGLTSIDGKVFNCIQLKYIYLPRSISSANELNSFFREVDTLYYGGSEEEFKSIVSDNIINEHLANIVYNTDVNSLE